MRFKNFIINESYINVFSPEEKIKYVDDVWNIIQSTYSRLGGIKGSGFSSKEDMISSIPMWKLIRKNGKIIAVQLYKDTNGRKFVAAGTDNSPEGKEELKKVLVSELKMGRAYGEISENIYNLLRNILGDEEIGKYTIHPDEVRKILGKEITPSDNGPSYFRNINGHSERKYMIGNPYQKISS